LNRHIAYVGPVAGIVRGGRAMAGLTQAQLAREAGVTKTGVSNIENSIVSPRRSTIDKIVRALESHGVVANILTGFVSTRFRE
jgi:predicted transcriptional regulator